DNLSSVKNVILVLSGKGGVGKSTLSVQIALGLVHAGKTVGILDTDVCGPSIPKMLNLENASIYQCDQGWVPVFATDDKKLCAMSIAFMLGSKDEPVIWRGPKKTAMIKQFLTDVHWGEMDYLIIDTPPGTSDEHLSVVQNLKGRVTGAILVTTPQAVAVSDVRRELTFCWKTSIPVLGVVENMSGYVCPHCSECSLIFSQGGGEELAKQENLRFLARIPLDPNLANCCETGRNLIDVFPDSATLKPMMELQVQTDYCCKSR
uniref:Cytosolic Fe-S cluster assembly factor NUBP2 homolog n=1 Tax=Ciona savignyi TaxID=51511 RepID=H2YN72_CIOSA